MHDERRSADDLLAENAELRAQVAELRARVAELEQENRDLARAAERDRRIMDRLPQNIYLFDINERKNEYTNRSSAELVGYTPEEFRAMGANAYGILIHPDDISRLVENLDRLRHATDDEVNQVEYRLRKRDGSYLHLLDRVVVFSRDDNGAPRLVLGSILDITEQREAELAVARFKMLVENALDGIFVLDRAGKILYGNKAFTAMMGPGDHVIGSSVWQWLLNKPIDRSGEESIARFLQMGNWRGRLEFQRADATRWTAQVDAIVLDEGADEGAAIAVFIRDITAELASEAERSALQAQVIEAQASALRELGTPLIPIADEVLAMPLIGAIDEARAQRIIEVLLGGIAAQRATVAILDITGVKAPDGNAADGLVRAARAVRLLGAEVVLTGVSPDAARTLIELGADLRGIVTQGSFQSGIAYALRRRGRA